LRRASTSVTCALSAADHQPESRAVPISNTRWVPPSRRIFDATAIETGMILSKTWKTISSGPSDARQIDLRPPHRKRRRHPLDPVQELDGISDIQAANSRRQLRANQCSNLVGVSAFFRGAAFDTRFFGAFALLLCFT